MCKDSGCCMARRHSTQYRDFLLKNITRRIQTWLSMSQQVLASTSRAPACCLDGCGFSKPQLRHATQHNRVQPASQERMQGRRCCHCLVQLLQALLAALLSLLRRLLLGCKLGRCGRVQQVDSCRQHMTAGTTTLCLWAVSNPDSQQQSPSQISPLLAAHASRGGAALHRKSLPAFPGRRRALTCGQLECCLLLLFGLLLQLALVAAFLHRLFDIRVIASLSRSSSSSTGRYRVTCVTWRELSDTKHMAVAAAAANCCLVAC